MNNWRDGKRLKPRTELCEKYCEHYATCNRTECSRRRLIINGEYKMKEAVLCDYHDQREKKRQYYEPRVTYTN